MVLQGSLLGLAAAHARGVVHRDYKPENVLVNGQGASKLTDFGIAVRAGDRAMAAGTLAYAPPEQFGGGPATPSGDVYAATATFYECLTGRPPFSGDTAERLMHQHLAEPVPLEPVPEPLRPLIEAGMAKDPGRRPADAAAFVAELRTMAAGAYGPDWEHRGRSHLGEAALLLAALWPSGAIGRGAGQRRAQGLAAPAPQAPAHRPAQGSHRGRRRRSRSWLSLWWPRPGPRRLRPSRPSPAPSAGWPTRPPTAPGRWARHQIHQGGDAAVERHRLDEGAQSGALHGTAI